MGKLKTKKSIVKRLRLTKNGKLMQRRGGQDHFNAHESGKTTRNKRRDISTGKTEIRNLKRGMPYA